MIYEYVIQFQENTLNFVFYGLMGFSLVPATWFQFTLVKWIIFVHKYSIIRERRLQYLLDRMEQEDLMNAIQRRNSRIAE
jgi:hypothetical protein